MFRKRDQVHEKRPHQQALRLLHPYILGDLPRHGALQELSEDDNWPNVRWAEA